MKFAFVILISGAVFAQQGVTHSVRLTGVTQRVEAEYTDEARAAKLQGTAQSWKLNEQGRLTRPRFYSALVGLDAKAIAAVGRWAFGPAVADDGIPIRSALTAAVRFQLGTSPYGGLRGRPVQTPPGRRPPRPRSKPILAQYKPPPAGACADTNKIAELQLTIDA